VAVGALWTGLAGPPISGLDATGQRVLGVFLFTLLLWLFKPVPFAVSSLASVTLLYVTGIVETFSAAVSGFATRLIFFLILLLLLGNTISKVELDQQLARRLLVTDSPRETTRLIAGNLLALSFLMPSALARAVAFLPIVRQLGDVWGLDEKSNFLRDSFLFLGHVNPVASMGLMTGGGMAILSSQFIRSSVVWISWVDWAVLMLPPMLFIFASTVVTILYVHPVADSQATSERQELSTEPFDRDQRIVMGIMIGVILLWIAGSFFRWPTILPAMIAVAVLSLPGVEIISGDDMAAINWGIIFVFGAMFSLLDVLESSGVLNWVVTNVSDVLPLAALPHWQTITLLLAMALLIRLFFSTASAALLVLFPIVLEFAESLGINELFISLALVMLVGSSTVFPFNTTTVLLTYDSGPLSMNDVVTTGLITTVYAAAAIVLCWTVYWPFVT
jgi:anion transporter